MKKNLNAWKRTISSVAALAIVLSLGMPFTTAFADETGTSTQPSSSAPAASTPAESVSSESSSVSSEAQPAEKWEDTAAKTIGTVSGRDGVEKVYNYLQGLEGHKDAQSFQTLAGKCGLTTSKVITGTLSGAAHSWNAVQIDDVWYAVDVAKGVLLAGAKTLLADGKTVFGDVYKTSDATVLSGESHQIVVTIRPTVNQKKIYGDADPSFSYTASITIGLDGTLSRVPGEDVGEYSYTLDKLKVKDAANAGKYKLELAKDASKFKIEARALKVNDVVLESNSKVFDGSNEVPVQQVTLDNVAARDAASGVSVDQSKVTAAVPSAEAKIYSDISVSGITLSGEKAKNYTVPETATVKKTFQIEEAKKPELENGLENNQTDTPVSNDLVQEEQNQEQIVNNAPEQTPNETANGETAEDVGKQTDKTDDDKITEQGTNDGDTPSTPPTPSDSGTTSDPSDPSQNAGSTESKVPVTVKLKTIEKKITFGDPDPKLKLTEDYTLEGTDESIELEFSLNKIENSNKFEYILSEQKSPIKEKYDFTVEGNAYLVVEPKEVEILFRSASGDNVDFNYGNATAYVKYNGSPKKLEAYYLGVDGEKKDATIVYNNGNDITEPTEVGTYNLSIRIDDNYTVKQPLAISKMVITEEVFTPKNQSVTISKNDTSGKTISLNEFGVPERLYSKVEVYNLEQDYVVESFDKADVAKSKLKVENGILYYQLLPNMQAGKKGNIVLRIEELNLYFRLTVVVGEQSLKMSVRNYPTNVTLGKDITIPSKCVLVATFDDKSETEEPVTLDMLSGYDKDAKGNDSIGIKTITVTSKKYPGSSANFDIRVNDTVVGLEVEQPDKVDYYTSDSSLDLSGGWVALKMQSGNLKDSKKLGFSMINRDHSILKRPGEYSVRVKYEGYTLSDAFTFTVERDNYWDYDDMYQASNSVPDSDDFGVSLSTNDLEGRHDRENIYLVVESSWDSELDDYMYKRSFDDYELMDLYLYDEYEDERVEIRSGREVTVYIPYPQGTSASRHNFTVYHLVGNTVRTEKVTALSDHLKVSVGSFSPFAVAWKQKSSISSGNSGSNLAEAVRHQQEMQEFWDDVTDTLKDTRSGRSVMVDAGDYDYVPSKVLKAIKDRDVTLKIENDTTKTIVLNGKKPPITGSLKTSYTMSELYDAVKGTTSSSSGGSNIVNNNTSASSLESLWSGVVKSLKSYQEGTSITVNAKDNSNIPKTVLDAVRGRNVTVKLKSESHPTITFNGKEMPVNLASQRQYTLQELYDATVPESVSDMEELWSGVTDDLKSYKAGAKVTISAGNNTFIPNTVLDAIRGRNVTIKIKSDYTSDLITLNGASLPKSLSGEKYYSISQLANRAKTGGTIIYPTGGTQQNNVQSSTQWSGQNSVTSGGNTGTATSQQVVSSQGGTGSGQSSSSQTSAVTPVSGSVGSSSSESSSKITAPTDTIIPPINGGEDTVPSIEETKKGDSILPKVIIGVMIFAILVVLGVLIFLLSGTRPRQR